MSYKDKMAAMRGELRVMNKLIPETMGGFATLSKAAKDAGVLGAKDVRGVPVNGDIAGGHDHGVGQKQEEHGEEIRGKGEGGHPEEQPGRNELRRSDPGFAATESW